jgi:tetratricopeptide (TPR) repeat protein
MIESVRAPAFDAYVHLAWGQIRLHENDAEGAVEELERAVERWRSIGAPYETAEAQMLLGLAFRRIGEEDAARDELRAAKSAFEKLGAALARSEPRSSSASTSSAARSCSPTSSTRRSTWSCSARTSGGSF